jgi:hypothetical protein
LSTPTPVRLRALVSALIALLLSAVSILVGATAASAAAFPDAIDPNSLKMDFVESSGVLHQWDRISVAGDWAVPDGARGGDTFSMTLPKELDAFRTKFDLLTADGEVMGTCLINGSPAVMACTLSDVVNGLADVHGSFQFQMRANATTDSKGGTFVIGGDPVTVTWPGGHGIVGADNPAISFAKHGSYSPNNGDPRILWAVTLTPDQLGESVRIKDTLARADGSVSGQHWAGYPSQGAVLQLADSAGGFPTIVPASRFSGGWDASGTSFDITIDLSGYDTSHGARLSYYTLPDDGTFDDHDTFANTATVDSRSVTAGYTYTDSSSGTGSGTNVGTMSIHKVIAGDGASLVPSGTTFTLRYTYGSTTKTLEVPMDGTVVKTASIPTGTVVTVTEVDLPAIAGVEWGTPVISGDKVTTNDDGSATVTIAGGTSLALTLTNTATMPVSQPTPTPSQTPTATPTPSQTPTATPTPSQTPTATASPTTPITPTPRPSSSLPTGTGDLVSTGGELGVLPSSVLGLAVLVVAALVLRRARRSS